MQEFVYEVQGHIYLFFFVSSFFKMLYIKILKSFDFFHGVIKKIKGMLRVDVFETQCIQNCNHKSFRMCFIFVA